MRECVSGIVTTITTSWLTSLIKKKRNKQTKMKYKSYPLGNWKNQSEYE